VRLPETAAELGRSSGRTAIVGEASGLTKDCGISVPRARRIAVNIAKLPHLQSIRVKVSRGGPMARNLREVIATLPAERRAKIAAAHARMLIAEEQKLIGEKKKWQLEEAKRLMELDHKLIVFAVLIAALPIVAALVWMLAALAVGDRF
jgi:hypothetical protein